MGRKSTKENKTKYQIIRDDLGMSRQYVEDITDGRLTAKRLENIESEETKVTPYDVMQMSEAYNCPELCNYFCTNECEIGAVHVPKVETIFDLPQTTLALLSSLNQIEEDKKSIIDMASDGIIDPLERAKFKEFQSHLVEMALAIESLKLWAKKELGD